MKSILKVESESKKQVLQGEVIFFIGTNIVVRRENDLNSGLGKTQIQPKLNTGSEQWL